MIALLITACYCIILQIVTPSMPKGGIKTQITSTRLITREQNVLSVSFKLSRINNEIPDIRGIETVYLHFYDIKGNQLKSADWPMFSSVRFVQLLEPSFAADAAGKIPPGAHTVVVELDSSGSRSAPFLVPKPTK